MKIKLSIAMALALILGVACTQQAKKGAIMEETLTLDNYELVGNVKSVKEKSYGTGTVDGEATNLLYNESVLMFDRSGRLISEKNEGEEGGYTATYEYDADGKLLKLVLTPEHDVETITVKTYDAQGRLIRSDLTIPDSIPMVFTDEYKYDQNNNLIETTGMSEGSMGNYKTVNVYDDKNRLIETIEDSGEEMLTKTVFAYNEADSLVSAKTYSSPGYLFEEILNSYNDKGQKIKTEYISYDEEGKVTYRRFEHYNELGLVTLQEDYNSDQIMSYKTENTYDPKGLLIEAVYSSRSEDNVMGVDSHSKYKYDDKGKLIEDVSNYPRQGYSQITKRVYEYDSRGNWTRLELIQIYDGEEVPIKNVTEREITYYD